MVAAANKPIAATKKNSARNGLCHAENHKTTTQNAIISPTTPIAIQPNKISRNR